jgi:hypothetical protein
VPCLMRVYVPKALGVEHFFCIMLSSASMLDFSNAVDMLTACPAGYYSVTGSSTCIPCGLGRFNPFSGQDHCTCCAAGTFANVSGLSKCLDCPDNLKDRCHQQCTANPSCSCNAEIDCDVNRCTSGCFFRNQTSTCEQAPAGSYTQCGSPGNCSVSSNIIKKCPRGSYSPATGASSNSTCTLCAAGSYCPNEGTAYALPCLPGQFSTEGADSCTLCRPGSFADANGSSSCVRCSGGTYCIEGAWQQCSCPINKFSPPPPENSDVGVGACFPCIGQAEPLVGQSECITEMPLVTDDVLLYWVIIGIFGAISFGSIVLVVILVRSRHEFSVRPFHSGICIYVASFAPYSLLKVIAVYKLLISGTLEQELTANLILNGTFMIFFCLGFGGKMALIQLWMHLISRHTSGESEQSLMTKARQTWKLIRLTVLIICVTYSVGFISLVAAFAQATIACSATSDSTTCIPPSLSGTSPPECKQAVGLVQGISYYEGIFAAVVAVVFTFYALMFNGLVYAVLTSDSTFSNLTKLQRMLISNKLLRWMLSPYVCTPSSNLCCIA